MGKTIYEMINDQIEQAPAGSNGLLFLPYLLGERAPRWDSFSKGTFIGITSETTRAEMLRSVLEGVTFNLAIILDVLQQHIKIEDMIIIGGGAKNEVWRQIIADVFGLTVKVPRLLDEAGSMGAAIIGGVGIGLYENFEVVEKFIAISQSQQNDSTNIEIYEKAKQRYDDFYFALRRIYEKHQMEGVTF